MNLDIEAKITQVLEVYDKNTNETNFFIEKNNEWFTISEKEYNKIIGENNE